jgi:hypothetical protein
MVRLGLLEVIGNGPDLGEKEKLKTGRCRATVEVM